MGNSYKVDLGELRSLVTNLENSEESMNSANDALKNTSAKDLGSNRLDSAGKDFQDKWEYGIGKLSDLAEKMTGGLKDTQQTYAKAEHEIRKLFPDPGGSGGGPGGGGAAGDGAAAGAEGGQPAPQSRIGHVLGGQPAPGANPGVVGAPEPGRQA